MGLEQRLPVCLLKIQLKTSIRFQYSSRFWLMPTLSAALEFSSYAVQKTLHNTDLDPHASTKPQVYALPA